MKFPFSLWKESPRLLIVNPVLTTLKFQNLFKKMPPLKLCLNLNINTISSPKTIKDLTLAFSEL